MDKYQSPKKSCVTRVNLVQMSRKCIVFSQTFNAIQGTPQQVIEWPKWILGTERRRMGHFSLFKANSQVIRKKVHIWFRRLWFFIGFSYPVFGAHGPRLESTWEPAIVLYISHLIQMESFAEKKRLTRRNFFIDILDFQRLKTTGYVVLLYFTACSFSCYYPPSRAVDSGYNFWGIPQRL